ncbi:MAG: hypothetical protein P8L85_03460 [Rubripirellula sp.]|nr:hypothetical protein [Rubripirellula sp.]
MSSFLDPSCFRWPTKVIAARLTLVLALVLTALSQSTRAQFLACELRSLSRAGGQSGTSFPVRATSGSNLEELDSLVFSHPGITAELGSLDPLPFSEQRRPDYGNFIITVAKDVPAGRYALRVAGRGGLSNPRALIVTTLPFDTATSVSHATDAATSLKPSTLTQAKATTAEIDYFQFPAEKSVSYRVELLAHQIDSRMIGQVIVYDPSGRQIALARGADDVDPVLEFEAELEGNYQIAIHDFTFRGGDEYPYQIVVQPLASAVDMIPVRPDARLHWLTRAATLPSNFVWDPTNTTPATIDQPQSLEIPATATRFFPDDHSDTVFRFAAAQDQTLAFDIASHRLGEPTDARLIVQRIEPIESAAPKLHTVLNVDDSQTLSDGAVQWTTKDPVGLLKVPVTADYQLVVRDLDVGRSLRDRQIFRVNVRPAAPGFDLVAFRLYPNKDINNSQPFGSKLFRGGSEVIRVMALRRDGWTGSIRINVENLPAGIQATETFIAANQTQTQIVLTATEDAANSRQEIRVVGTNEDGTLEQTAVPATIAWGKGAGRDYIRTRLMQQLFVAVSDRDLSPLTITVGDNKVVEVKKGEAISLPVKITRREGGKTNVVLRARDFPPGASGADLTIAADKSEGSFAIKTGKTPPGTYSLWLQAESKIKVKPNPQSLQRAQAYRDSLQKLQEDPTQKENLEAIKAAIVAADKAIEAAKPLAADRELTVYLPTSNVTLRVIEP